MGEKFGKTGGTQGLLLEVLGIKSRPSACKASTYTNAISDLLKFFELLNQKLQIEFYKVSLLKNQQRQLS